MRCLPLNPPAHFSDLMAGAEGVTFLKMPDQAEVVHLFCPDRATLDAQFETTLSYVKPGGMLWISWPKKSSKLHKDLSEDDLRTVILPTGWVDVKVCAVDADWSGLKFLRRKA